MNNTDISMTEIACKHDIARYTTAHLVDKPGGVYCIYMYILLEARGGGIMVHSDILSSVVRLSSDCCC